MAAPKKSTSSTQADASATRTKARPRTGAGKNTKPPVAEDSTNPSATKSKTSATKKAAPIKLTDRQLEFLKKIQSAGDAGYEPANKNEQKSVDS